MGRNLVAALLGALLLSASAYLGAAQFLAGDLGYPLDDSWIHQTLARNLVATGQWAINPGEPAPVSTAPLWTLLVVLGYWLPLPGLAWTYLLGAGSLAWAAWETLRLGRVLFPKDTVPTWLAGLLVLGEWHLVWATWSGMETVLFTALSLAVLRVGLERPAPTSWRWGVLLSLLLLTRPEGLLLGMLVIGWRLARAPSDARRAWVASVIPFLLAIMTMAVLNTLLSGQPLPSTFFAKHAAYGIGLDPLGYLRFFADAAIELARGPLLLLYPGLVFSLARHLPSASSDGWLPLLWAGALVGGYALWLPTVYHHGRYLVPLLPLLMLYGLHGSRELFAAIPSPLLLRVAPVILALVTAAAWLRGAQVYGENVQFVKQQQVTLALWIRGNTPADARIASHDIGALGYYAQRPLVDMAGLASPELTNTPKDVSRIMALLEEKEVSYLVIQPNWYPPLYQALTSEPGTIVVKEAPETAYGVGNSFQVLRRQAE